ncbi:phosphoenolpyruvate synthase [Marinomonas mediterranea]|uniref:Phosphoenolpyruvate synthase n=1 Tax=Marinomonas mediterranea (strain ATCC 700492 / JCM 21426 / NBRC 103028 / MMB-1) TaxID=717774 RepID=F2K2Z6_MARM1|nr:phosphoenolpyruvate synthase [Marinomonas mediterranea]ADZ92385.1 phosphoenolpyruvate synthase [Marinomonas mediterranea MMB-1]WCN14381.1 phosphoenolpyruvate synthase [Marinomonas mediterranea]WCN18433.1 phosphoenolpyruvate synthase [Marinomonas mediterranea MMB-1]
MSQFIKWFSELRLDDVGEVGGKNASLGEMISNLSDLNIQVPNGFATTAYAYQTFLEESGLNDKIHSLLDSLDVDDVQALAQAGDTIRNWVEEAPFSDEFNKEIEEAFKVLSADQGEAASFAVRSSATAEDLPDASFAGQQETYLNVEGLDNIKSSIKRVFASLYNDRAISYRVHQGFEHKGVALSAGIQKMVRSDIGSSGVLFTLDTESGFDEVVFITAAYGLGEMVVQGTVNPDEYYVHKPTLENERPAVVRKTLGSKAQKMEYAEPGSDDFVKIVPVKLQDQNQFALTNEEVEDLARQAMIIEKHYQRPMDIEWAKDGIDGKIYIVQARPETVRSQSSAQSMERYNLKETSSVLVTGRAIGHKIGSGAVKVLSSITEMDRIQQGDVLVTDITDPDWEPIMKRASAIITNRGGRTCHAAIIARELGIPAVVGCGDATKVLKDGQNVTVSCSQGDMGFVYQGNLEFDVVTSEVGNMPEAPVKVMMNVGNPNRAFDFAMLPNAGVGLARLEFIINRMIGIHPKALINYSEMDAGIQEEIDHRIAGYNSPIEFYVDKLVEGIATLACSFSNKPVIVRLSDFKSNEYHNLVGGPLFEPDEENPMLGFRGAARYIDDSFRDCFALECQAVKRVRNEMGLTNVQIMIPFVRTLEEAQQVTELLAEHGLSSGENGLKIIMMCELPSNALLADEFLEYFDGFSIGSNDLTQLTLGLDRDSGLIADKFDERNPAVKKLLKMAIDACRAKGKYVGICGQGPSDHADFADWLVEQGIESVSLNPDTVIETWLHLSETQSNGSNKKDAV